MPEGTIIRALSGFYDIKNDEGVFRCRARGLFRKQKVSPLVGDYVRFELEGEEQGVVTEIGARKNSFVRPPIANVDQVLLVFSALQPDFSTQLLDRFLVLVEAEYVNPIIIMSKMDLTSEAEKEQLQEIKKDYEAIGYPVIVTSTKTNEGIEDLTKQISGKINVVSGQSGVGKSSLLNAIEPNLALDTAEISTHLGRGKHTTRHVELIEFDDGYIADTPGFSTLDLTHLEPERLTDYFMEMKQLKGDCKFRGCVHDKEPQCAVKENVAKGIIPHYRYDHYLLFLEEIKNKRRF